MKETRRCHGWQVFIFLGETFIVKRLETEHYVVTLNRRGNVADSQFKYVELDITTREFQHAKIDAK